MENIPLPSKIESKKIDSNKSEIIIEPLYPGYGTTLGNALRRVLLSSLPGAAVVAVKIKDVQHEFSTLTHVKEDIVDILLNVKQLRLKLSGNHEAKLQINVSGEKDVKASDIKKVAGVEIANPNLHLATLSDKAAKLEMELNVATGRGYIPVEQRENEKLEVNYIAVDAIYTPIKLVNFEVENVRVEQMTNYNRLRVIVETDGTVTPEDAFSQALEILVGHFSHIAEKSSPKKKAAAEKKAEKKEETKKEKKIETKGEKEIKEEEDLDKEVKEEKKKRGRPKKEK
ncbi:MAG: DNA-directed RNA polymerase subunit alpha [Patescibacteria group bacterium]